MIAYNTILFGSIAIVSAAAPQLGDCPHALPCIEDCPHALP